MTVKLPLHWEKKNFCFIQAVYCAIFFSIGRQNAHIWAPSNMMRSVWKNRNIIFVLLSSVLLPTMKQFELTWTKLEPNLEIIVCEGRERAGEHTVRKSNILCHWIISSWLVKKNMWYSLNKYEGIVGWIFANCRLHTAVLKSGDKSQRYFKSITFSEHNFS